MKNGLSKIQIRNYQSLKKLDIDLGDITVITGKSDSGKSAFFRAVKAVVSNEAGEGFTTIGEKKTVIKLDDVIWIQSKTENSYKIGEQEWQKVGRGVPEEVATELNMGSFEFGKGVKYFLNFSGQLEPSFITQGNPADNAKIIGAISNIHIVYNALREAEKDTKATRKRITGLEENLEETVTQLKEDQGKFSVLDKQYHVVKEVYEKAKELDNEQWELYDVKGIMESIQEELAILVPQVKGFLEVDFPQMEERISVQEELARVREEIDGIDGKISLQERILQGLEGFSTELCENLLTEQELLSEAKSELERVEDNISKQERDLDFYVAEMKSIVSDMEALGICEVCGAEKKHWNIGGE